MVKEYWHRPDANARDFKEGWFNSGDIGYFDSEGYLFLSGRAKDMIIRGGENIYPTEIEAVISDHPRVEEVAVFGVEDQQLGETVAIAVVAKAAKPYPAMISKPTLTNGWHGLKYRVCLVAHKPLPRNDTGKVLKKDLKAEYATLQ